jgi:hypothetical protein
MHAICTLQAGVSYEQIKQLEHGNAAPFTHAGNNDIGGNFPNLAGILAGDNNEKVLGASLCAAIQANVNEILEDMKERQREEMESMCDHVGNRTSDLHGLHNGNSSTDKLDEGHAKGARGRDGVPNLPQSPPLDSISGALIRASDINAGNNSKIPANTNNNQAHHTDHIAPAGGLTSGQNGVALDRRRSNSCNSVSSLNVVLEETGHAEYSHPDDHGMCACVMFVCMYVISASEFG